MGVRLRIGTSSDAEEMLRIATAAIDESGYSDEQKHVWAAAFSAERITSLAETSFIMVAEEFEMMRGFATLVERGETAGELDMWYVDPEFKKRGIGKLLVRAIEDRARQQDMTALWVDASEPAAHRLEQLGYRVHDAYKKTVDGVLFRNTWMLKRYS